MMEEHFQNYLQHKRKQTGNLLALWMQVAVEFNTRWPIDAPGMHTYFDKVSDSFPKSSVTDEALHAIEDLEEREAQRVARNAMNELREEKLLNALADVSKFHI